MNRKSIWITLAMLVCMAFSSCSQPMPTPAVLTPAPTLEKTHTATIPPHMVRLPIIKNGSDFTPTPFLPHESTPVYLPTQIPYFDSSSQVKDLRPVSPLVTAVPKPMPLLGDQATAKDDLINILLVGSDRSSGRYFRTDTLIIASIRPRQQVVSLISIPRDLFVYIPGWTMQRINTAYLHGEMSKYPGGGAALLKDTIRYNLGIHIDKLAIVDFNGFKQIVDVIGGVDLPLVCAYTDWHVINPRANLENPNNWKLYTVGPGVVHMDGDLALWYARSRLRSNDFDRGRRQQEVLRGIYTKALQIGVLPRIPELYQEVSEIVVTDIGLNQILALAPMALRLDAPRIRSYYISSKYVKGWWTPQGASVLLPKQEKLQLMLEEAMLPPDEFEEDRLALVIEIINDTATSGMDVLAAERLHYAGFETAILRGTGEPAKKTWLYAFPGASELDQGAFILDILGLPVDRLGQDDASGSQAAYRLVIGNDYNPCFNPSKLKR